MNLRTLKERLNNIESSMPPKPAKIVHCPTAAAAQKAEAEFKKESKGKFSILLCIVPKNCRRRKEE